MLKQGSLGAVLMLLHRNVRLLALASVPKVEELGTSGAVSLGLILQLLGMRLIMLESPNLQRHNYNSNS